VTKWCREFSEVRTHVHDEQRSVSSSLISDDLLQEIEAEIRANRCVRIRELHYIIPEVPKTPIHEGVTEKLGHRKMCARWVPKMLTDDHKTKRIGSALKFLTPYAQEGNAFLDSIVTRDEIRALHHNPESKQQFDDDDKAQEEVMVWFKGQVADFYDSGIKKLVQSLNIRLDNAGDNFEIK